MKEESKMLNFTADLCHPRTSGKLVPCLELFPHGKMHSEQLISRMFFWLTCTLIVIKTCYNLPCVCYQKQHLTSLSYSSS